MDVKEQYACTKVMPLGVEITTRLHLQGEGDEGHPDRRCNCVFNGSVCKWGDFSE